MGTRLRRPRPDRGQGAGTLATGLEVAGVNVRDCADYVACVCRNNPVWGGGFWSATLTEFVSPAKESAWDGHTIGCLDCGRLIDTDPAKILPVPTTSPDEVLPWIAPVIGTLPDGWHSVLDKQGLPD